MGSVTEACRTWKTSFGTNEEMKELEEAYQGKKSAKTGVVCDGVSPKSSDGFDKRKQEEK